MKKVLFLLENSPTLKLNPEYLYDRFVKYTLRQLGTLSDIYLIDDIGEIQPKIEEYKPTHVVLPAMWLSPQEFSNIHSTDIVWILRIPKNSSTMQLLNESIEWLYEYTQNENTIVSCNANKEFLDDIRDSVQDLTEWSDEITSHKIMTCDNVMQTILLT